MLGANLLVSSSGPNPVSGRVVTVKVLEFDIAPSGLATVMDLVPGVSRLAEGMTAVSLVAETKVVDRFVVPILTVAPLTKLVPFTVRVVAELSALTAVGEMLVIVGAAWAYVITGKRKSKQTAAKKGIFFIILFLKFKKTTFC